MAKAMIPVVVVLSLLLSISHAFLWREVPLEQQQDYPEQWFTQKLDHFNAEDSRTFQQRFYVNDNYFKGGNSPILLYINGEGPVSGPPSQPNDEVVLLAQDLGAVIVTPEHRYYGKSVPFTTQTTDNLRYLSSKQALADLAHFVTDFQLKIELETGGKNRILSLGCSYSGALSAWFRLKYPQITELSISSSGVVNAILDFTAFDAQIPVSVGEECANILRKTTGKLEQLVLASGSTVAAQTKDLFQASMLTVDGDFFYLMADIMATSVQYGYQDDLCIPMVDAFNTLGEEALVKAFANFTINFWYGKMGTAEVYSTAWQQSTVVAEERNYRQWWFQKCTELAYFQNAPAVNSIRSYYVNMTYHRDHCKAVFGQDLWPDTAATNAYYGGNNTAATKVFFANGSQDPWQHAGVRSSLSDTEPAQIIQCHNCGHCVDLRECPGGCSPSDKSVEAARLLIRQYVHQWLANNPTTHRRATST